MKQKRIEYYLVIATVQDLKRRSQLASAAMNKYNKIWTSKGKSILLNKIQSMFVCFEWTRKRLDGF